MPRAITEESRQRVYEMHTANPDALGLALGAAVLRANVPLKAIAELLTAS